VAFFVGGNVIELNLMANLVVRKPSDLGLPPSIPRACRSLTKGACLGLSPLAHACRFQRETVDHGPYNSWCVNTVETRAERQTLR
jgi:hypothetical protein